jgi:hypothetical protein
LCCALARVAAVTGAVLSYAMFYVCLGQLSYYAL